jgi:hypothetical protein
MRRSSSVEEEDSNYHESVSVGWWTLHMKAQIMKIPLLSVGLLLTATIAVSYVVSHDVTAQAPEGTSQRAASSTPRLPDGRPDLNGTWIPEGGGRGQTPLKLPDGSVCVTNCADLLPPAPAVAGRAGGGGAPAPGRGGARGAGAAPQRNFPNYKPEYLAKVKELNDNQVKLDTALQCQPPGVPRIGPPDKIVQTAKEVVFLYDDLNGPFFRIVPIDGRAHRPATAWRGYLGDAVGKWEDDTLVVETINFNDETWLIDNGAFHTKDLRVVERLRRTGDKLEYRATSYDPAVLAEPWEGRVRNLQLTDIQIEEPVRCEDRDLAHVVDGAHHDNAR